MSRRLWAQIAKRDGVLGLGDELGTELAAGNPAKDTIRGGVGHRSSLLDTHTHLHVTGRRASDDEGASSMPELPEVETVRRSLLPHILGRRIDTIRITDFPGVFGDADPATVAALVHDQEIVGVRRRAKYLILDLADGASLVIHLRMTGSLTLTDRSASALRHERLAIALSDGKDLRFADQRKFGRVLHMLPVDLARIEARLGPEPLEDKFTASELSRRLSRRTGPLKSVLLDQSLVGGLGNIYVDEALFRARLHPRSNPTALNGAEIRRLHRAIRAVLNEAIANRGTSISSFRDGEGIEGGNQANLHVYGRGRLGEPCPRCGTPIQRIVIGGRGTHFCPRCQALSDLKCGT